MRRFVDCFLYHNEVQLLEVRLQLLQDVVDRFVIAYSDETFTGRRKSISFPDNNPVLKSLNDKIEVIRIKQLKGRTAWDRESYSRNQLTTGLHGLSQHDLVMVSDIDEIPRPSVVESLKSEADTDDLRVLELDYFNFKFNFKMFHGVQAVWPGPTVAKVSGGIAPQSMRDRRWDVISNPERGVRNAGWHFSFLTETESVADKLTSFSHQEREIQRRSDRISKLLEARNGFHDHIQPNSIWGFVELASLQCPKLEALIRQYPRLYEASIVDDSAVIAEQVKRSMATLCTGDRAKVLRWCTSGEMFAELGRRLIRKLTVPFTVKQ